ncbi:MAG: type IX secretion system membrane protein PorP/SprF [Burkholderiales bacterium]|nr:type IX secretion system membrane protein PorP/SprF [Bacteroidia bacterium]
MKRVKIFIITYVFCIATINLKAQYDAMFTQYMFNEMFVNPAYAGSKEALAATALHRQQWVNFAGRPVTTTFTLHGPMYNNKMGIGLSVLNEKIGVLSRNLVYLNYAYRIKAGKKGHLSLGLMAGIHSQTNKFTELQTTEANDSQFTVNTKNVMTTNFGSGIYYYTPKFYVGLSIPRMIDDNTSVTSTGSLNTQAKIHANKFHYYFTIGSIYTLNESLKLKPQLMIKAVSNAPVEMDINVNALIKEKIWLGVSYRSKSDASVIFGIQVNPQFIVSYAYDYSLTTIQKFSAGSHEIALGYLFGFKGKKILSNRYF